MDNFWLKPNICFEPLIWSWNAWTQLVAPITAGANLKNRYLKILSSYLAHPELHEKACKNPQLIGGPYVDLDRRNLNEVRKLSEKILSENKKLFDLITAIEILQHKLNQAEGYSLEELYKEIPDALSGAVELVYDLQNSASMRLIEPILYQEYYDTSGHSAIISSIDNDARPFVLSTPRIICEKDIQINLPFDSKALDLLFKSRRIPCSLNHITSLLNIQKDKLSLFKTFFTNVPPPKIHEHYDENNIRIRYFGHACILIETKDTAILIDPLVSYEYEANMSRYTYLDLPNKIDYVLITHGHQDHIDFETLLQIRHQVKTIIVPQNNNGFIADPSIKLILENIGFNNILSLREMEKMSFIDGDITAIPFLGEHGDLNIQSKLAYHISIKNKKILFAVDSNNLDTNLYSKIAKKTGPVDILFIGLECLGAPYSWIYGPLFSTKINREFDQTRRLNGSDSEKAWKIAQELCCKELYIYAMGQEPWLRHIMGLEYTKDSVQLKEAHLLLEKCLAYGIKAELPYCKREWIYNC